MRQNTTIPSVIEKFREQRQRMAKLLIAFIMLIIVGIAVPLVLGSFPILQNSSALKVMVITWGSLVGITFLILVIAAIFNQRCPVCGTPVGEEFWTVRYCSHCGTKLTDN
ncbi:MAG: zinc ribbon domain-containing protein [Chloroflexi bacterium]|nr:MAG: zinc ribbon domain-containing protein [Chloroflexota bacterium]